MLESGPERVQESLGVGRRLSDTLRVQPGENVERIPSLAVPTPRLAVARSVPHALENILFPHLLDLRLTGKSARPEAVSEDGGQRLAVRQKPCLHALHHEVSMFVRGSRGFGPPSPCRARRCAHGPTSAATGASLSTSRATKSWFLGSLKAVQKSSYVCFLPPPGWTLGRRPARPAFSKSDLNARRHSAFSALFPLPPPST